MWSLSSKEPKHEQPQTAPSHKARASGWFVFPFYMRKKCCRERWSNHTSIFLISTRDVQGAALSWGSAHLPHRKLCWNWRKTTPCGWQGRPEQSAGHWNKERQELWLCLSINSLITQMNQRCHLESLSLSYINSFIWTPTPRCRRKAIMPN